MDFIESNFGTNNFAEWQSASAFNTYWQYSYVNRSAFYANINGTYRTYMTRWVQNFLWWYDGWVPYFHNNSQGIFSTKLATALVNGTAKKVVGGRIYFKTKNKEKLVKNEKGEYEINKALAFITSEWSDNANFPQEVKKAVAFSASAGYALLKLDRKGDNKLSVKALRADSFYPVIGFNGELIELTCFIRDFTNISTVGRQQHFQNYYVVEHRYFGDYTRFDGSIIHNAPQVAYEIRQTTGVITNNADYDGAGQKIEFASLPKNIRSKIGKAFRGIEFDKPVLLPFVDNLGAQIVNWTDCVSAIPELPFGDSLLYNIMPYLQSYDYYWSAFNTDMYLGRGRVLVDKEMQSPQAKAQNVNDYNSGLDSMLFTQIRRNAGMGEPLPPTPIQFDLRSQSWEQIRTMIIQNIAINTGLNLASIASFLNDTNSARTAREISTEESETALFVDDKREIIERPLNRLLKIVTTYYGYTDDVVIRWSSAGLSNIYARSEMIATGLSNGFISPQKAVQMFNQDLDEYQLQEEFDNIKAEKESRREQEQPLGNEPFNEQDYFGNGSDEPLKEEQPQQGALTGDEDSKK